jgi:inorganic pyrophosphatase
MIRKIAPGVNVPDDINVIIEIPAHSEPVKYEVDKHTGVLSVDRFLTATMRYPCDYGYIPNTLAEDGDPIDVLVVSPFPLLSGSVIRVRPIGMLKMTDESGKDAKILAVPITKLTKIYQHIQKPGDLFPLLLDQISHFFQHYKDLEKVDGKWVTIEGWEESELAKETILQGIKRYKEEALVE